MEKLEWSSAQRKFGVKEPNKSTIANGDPPITGFWTCLNKVSLNPDLFTAFQIFEVSLQATWIPVSGYLWQVAMLPECSILFHRSVKLWEIRQVSLAAQSDYFSLLHIAMPWQERKRTSTYINIVQICATINWYKVGSMFRLHAIDRQVFLSRPGQPGSEVTFGGQDLRRMQGPMAWVRLPRDVEICWMMPMFQLRRLHG